MFGKTLWTTAALSLLVTSGYSSPVTTSHTTSSASGKASSTALTGNILRNPSFEVAASYEGTGADSWAHAWGTAFRQVGNNSEAGSAYLLLPISPKTSNTSAVLQQIVTSDETFKVGTVYTLTGWYRVQDFLDTSKSEISGQIAVSSNQEVFYRTVVASNTKGWQRFSADIKLDDGDLNIWLYAFGNSHTTMNVGIDNLSLVPKAGKNPKAIAVVASVPNATLTNPSFEETVSRPINAKGWFRDQGKAIAVKGPGAKEGSRFMRIPVANNTVAQIHQTIENQDPFTTYEFSCFVRVPTMSKTGTMKPVVWIQYMDAGVDDAEFGVATHTFDEASDDWVQIKGLAISDEAASMTGTLIIQGVGQGPWVGCEGLDSCTHTSFELDVDACSMSKVSGHGWVIE